MLLHKNKARFKVVFLCLYSYQYTSIAIRQFHQILKNQDIDVVTIFFKNYTYFKNTLPSQREYELLYKTIYTIKPDIICISVFSTVSDIARKITETLKQNINTEIIWGGHHPTIEPEECIKYADAINIGEGFYSLPKLIDAIMKSNRNIKIPNTWIKNASQIIKNQTGFLVDDLDEIPFTDYSDENKLFIDNNRIYLRNKYHYINGRYYIISQIGCPFSCSFCCSSQLKNTGKYIRRRTVENVIRELENSKKIYKFQYVEFWDDVFTLNLDWLKNFSREYKFRISLPASCYSHIKTVNEDIVYELQKAGIKRVALGIQSGSEKIRKESYNRYETNKQILRAAELFNKYKILVNYDFIIVNPEETNQDMKQSFELISKLPHPLALSVSTLLYFPNCEITVRHLKNNLITRKDVENIAKKAFKEFGLLIKLNNNKNYCYWSFMYFMAGYIKLPIIFKKILCSKIIYNSSKIFIYPIYYLLKIILLLQSKYPEIKCLKDHTISSLLKLK